MNTPDGPTTNVTKSQGVFTSRTKARKRAADVIFEAEQKKIDRPEGLRELLQERRVVSAAQTPLPEYSQEIVAGVADNLAGIDSAIQDHSKVKDLDRLPGVDLAVLRVAVWEMLHNSKDLDPIIAIDEAVAIVKSISTDRSPAFVNAVLDAVRKDRVLGLSAQGDEEKGTIDAASVVPQGTDTDEMWDELLDEY